MVRRTVMMCHGLCAVIGTTLTVAQEWEDIARRVLREAGGWRLDGESWLPKPGLARHMGVAEWSA